LIESAAEIATMPIEVKRLGVVEYEHAWQAMRDFTRDRTSLTADEIWLLQHPSVYTVGVAGRAEHLPRAANATAVVRVDRGGQITYHGPGQWIAYCMLDIHRRGITVRSVVRRMEQAVIDLAGDYGIQASRRDKAPGVYIDGTKLAALGLRVRNGCTYHGLALNVNMDLTPYDAIDPCGYPGMRVTDLFKLGVNASMEAVGDKLLHYLMRQFGDGIER
jgi:lipoyl(octanoyl) transferase